MPAAAGPAHVRPTHATPPEIDDALLPHIDQLHMHRWRLSTGLRTATRKWERRVFQYQRHGHPQTQVQVVDASPTTRCPSPTARNRRSYWPAKPC